MRIISGKYRGRKLFEINDQPIRPTLDRVKETMFDIIQFEIAGSRVLDLFAGTGALGIECISRGASEVAFCDVNPKCIRLLRQNLDGLKLDSQPVIYTGGWQETLVSVRARKIDLLFLDPPFRMDVYYDVLKRVSDLSVIEEDGIVVCEHPVDVVLPASVGKLSKWKDRKIGKVMLTYYKPIVTEISEKAEEYVSEEEL